jgi:hypothetical protein
VQVRADMRFRPLVISADLQLWLEGKENGKNLMKELFNEVNNDKNK